MTTFLIALLFAIGGLMVVGAPLFVVAWKRGRKQTIRRFLVAGGVLAIFIAAFAASSAQLESQCRAAGNPTCLDYGFEGFMFVIGVGWLITSWTVAYMIHHD